jgi:hypothetical protein
MRPSDPSPQQPRLPLSTMAEAKSVPEAYGAPADTKRPRNVAPTRRAVALAAVFAKGWNRPSLRAARSPSN